MTQVALWLAFAVGASTLLMRAPLLVAFKLWALSTAGVAVALVGGVADEARYRRVANGFGIALCASTTLAIAQLFVHPFLYLSAFVGAIALLLAIRGPGPSRWLAFAILVPAVAFGLAEATAFSLASRNEVTTEIVDRKSGRLTKARGFSVPDRDRGFAGMPDSEVRVRFSIAGRPVYDVVYILDADGRRHTPGAEGAPSVVFLGDSFAFGEGVNDDETAAAQLARLDPSLRVVNFGFKAYGPHQALATLEAGLETKLLPNGAPAAGVYFATYDAGRAAGRAFWDTSGPRYVLGPNGEPVHRGSFSDDRKLRALALLGRSYLLREIVRKRLLGAAERELFVALVERTSRLFRERHGGPFVVVLWPAEGDTSSEAAVRALRERGVETLTIEELVPEPAARQRLLLDDGHPNAEGQALVARELARALAGRPGAS